MKYQKYIILLILLLILSCDKDTKYTKGFPFWKYDWQKGELMAIYKGIGGQCEWKYFRYFSVPDTIINLNNGEKHFAPFETLQKRFIFCRISGVIFDYSTIKINEKRLYFPGIEKEYVK